MRNLKIFLLIDAQSFGEFQYLAKCNASTTSRNVKSYCNHIAAAAISSTCAATCGRRRPALGDFKFDLKFDLTTARVTAHLQTRLPLCSVVQFPFWFRILSVGMVNIVFCGTS